MYNPVISKICLHCSVLRLHTYEIKSKACLRVTRTKFFMKLEMKLMIGQVWILKG